MAVLPVGGTLFAPGGGLGGSGGSGVATPSLGKNSKQQNLGSPHSGQKSTLASGDTMSRSMGQYGKGHSFSGLAGGNPLKQIRGGMGGMRRIRGGLGPGKAGQPGSSKDYSMTSPDSE
jgi:hypothetical protein